MIGDIQPHNSHFRAAEIFWIPHDDSNLGHLQNTFECYENNSFVIRTVRWNWNTRFRRWWKSLMLMTTGIGSYVTIPIHNFNILWVMARFVNICAKRVCFSQWYQNTSTHSSLVFFSWYPIRNLSGSKSKAPTNGSFAINSESTRYSLDNHFPFQKPLSPFSNQYMYDVRIGTEWRKEVVPWPVITNSGCWCYCIDWTISRLRLAPMEIP